MDVVLALGFDLFFKPRLHEAAKQAGVAIRYATPPEVEAQAAGASRVIADVSAPGVEDALVSLRKHHPHVPILACYPHVEERRAEAVRALGGVAVTRGHFSRHLPEALAGTLS